jgi:hypothetical protein
MQALHMVINGRTDRGEKEATRKGMALQGA